MTFVDFGRGPTTGDWNVRWVHGSRSSSHPTDPPLQVHWYDAHSAVMRESKDVSYEAPFLYLLFGNERALLLDTGATSDPGRFPLRRTVDGLVAEWVAKNPRERYGLIVAHTHGHGDHVAGDPQFLGRADTIVVPKDQGSVRSFFNITDWPEGRGVLDLGGRVLEALPTPGHDPRSVSIYDPWTGFLITGDTVYPGRLYAFDFPAFVKSLNRLVSFAGERKVTHIVGCHIEMTRTPHRDYPISTRYQPDEPPLQMTPEQLTAVRDAAEAVSDRPGAHSFDDFIIFNGPCRGAVVKQLARASFANLRHRLGSA